MTIHYDSMTLVDDNQLVVEVDCATCVNGSPTDSCTCFNGREYEHVDLSILLRNIAVAGGLSEVHRQALVGAYRAAPNKCGICGAQITNHGITCSLGCSADDGRGAARDKAGE